MHLHTLIYNSLLGYFICQGHFTEEKGGRYKEETFAEYLLLMLGNVLALSSFFPSFGNGPVSLGTGSYFFFV